MKVADTAILRLSVLRVSAITCWVAILGLGGFAVAQTGGGAVVWAPTVRAPERPSTREAVTPLGPSVGAPQQTVVLPPLSAGLLAELQQEDAAASHTRIRIGLSRALEEPVLVSRQSANASAWPVLPNGWRIYSVELLAPGAQGLRLHVEAVQLPAGARLLTYVPQQAERAHSAITMQDLGAQGDIWTEPILADSVVLECQVPPGADPGEVSFAVAELAHRYRSAPALAQPRAESCENDATCYANWADQEAAVARIDFIDQGEEYLCSGCLLNHQGTNVADYFLTANHCIDNQSSASSIYFYWLYQTTACDEPDTAPNLDCEDTSYTAGATLLANSPVNDFSFLQLQEAPATGVFYAGWTTEVPATQEKATILHHPGLPPDRCGETPTDYTRISFGNIVGTANLYELSGTGSGTADNVWEVQWYSGVTEDGSSGSPLFDTNQLVIGQLYGGTSDCTNQTGQDIFGRFDVTYPSISQWLGSSAYLPGSTNSSSSLPSPGFVPGKYEGLFYPAKGATPDNSGTIALNLAADSAYSGKLLLGATRYSFTGSINSTGLSSTVATSSKGALLDVALEFFTGTNLIGTVSNRLWSAPLAAEQAVFNSRTNPATQAFASRYNLVIPPDINSGPAGYGYAALQVKPSGQLTLSGALADGTALTQSATLLAGGQCPIYVPLYHNQGVIVGWLTLSNSGLSGSLSWTKPVGATTKNYLAGFTNLALPALGSSYDHTVVPLITVSNGIAILTSAALGAAETNTLTYSASDRLEGVAPLSLNVSAGTGLFSGSVRLDSGGRVSFHGALLQNQNVGYGYFLEDNQSGSVSLGSQ
jgi:hypothetical protein